MEPGEFRLPSPIPSEEEDDDFNHPLNNNTIHMTSNRQYTPDDDDEEEQQYSLGFQLTQGISLAVDRLMGLMGRGNTTNNTEAGPPPLVVNHGMKWNGNVNTFVSFR